MKIILMPGMLCIFFVVITSSFTEKWKKITLRNRALIGKLVVTQLVKKIPTVYGT